MKRFRIDSKYIYWGITALVVVAISTSFFWLLQKLPDITAFLRTFLDILTPFIWGFVITYLLTPLVHLCEQRISDPLMERFLPDYKKRRSLARGISITLSLILSFTVVAALLMMVLPQVYESIESIVISLPDYANRAIAWVNELLQENPELKSILTTVLGDVSLWLTTWLQTDVLAGVNNILSSVSTSIYKVIIELFNILIGVVVSCYLLFNRERFGGGVRKMLYSLFSEKQINTIYQVAGNVSGAFMDFISGKLLDSLIIGFLCGICCAIMQMPYVMLISVVIGVTNIIPFFGPFIGAVPCALLVFMVSPFKCLMFVIFIVILQQIDGNIIGPKILGGTTGISGFWVMFAILVGQGFFGVVGLILGVPVMSLVYAMVKALIESALEARGLPIESENYEVEYKKDYTSGRKKAKKAEAASGKNTDPTSEKSFDEAIDEAIEIEILMYEDTEEKANMPD